MDDLVGIAVEAPDERVVIVRLTGELDLSVAQPVGKRISESVPRTARGVVVDMTGLEFMDSSGVSMLFSLARRVGSHRQELRVVAPAGRPVARVLQIVEFDRAAPVHGDLDSAVAAIATPEAEPPRG